LGCQRVSFNSLVENFLALIKIVYGVVDGVTLFHDLLDLLDDVLDFFVRHLAQLHDRSLLSNEDLLFVEVFFQLTINGTLTVLFVVHLALLRLAFKLEVIELLVHRVDLLITLKLLIMVLAVIGLLQCLDWHRRNLCVHGDVDICTGVAPLSSHKLLVFGLIDPFGLVVRVLGVHVRSVDLFTD
jgi:hypothetical protein